MLQLSLDGRRLYVTNSLYSTWDNQFYPDLPLVAAARELQPGQRDGDRPRLLRRLLRPPGRVARAHEVRLQGGDYDGDLPRPTFAHVAGVPLEESLLALAPVASAFALLVGARLGSSPRGAGVGSARASRPRRRSSTPRSASSFAPATAGSRRVRSPKGASHGLVHYYFGSMENLLARVLERYTERMIARQRAMYAAPGVPFLEKWRTAMRPRCRPRVPEGLVRATDARDGAAPR